MQDFLLNYAPMISFLAFIGMYSTQITKTARTKDVSGISKSFYVFLTIALAPKLIAQIVSFIKFGTYGLLLAESVNFLPAVIMMILVFVINGKDKKHPKYYQTDEINNSILEYKKENRIKTKEISDGYHTFDELYYHRMMLFSVILNNNKDKAWKSWLHHDGTMFGNSFIVGVETSEGQYTYHYKPEFWDNFDVKELNRAPEYDGHQPKDITRLLTLVKE